MRGGLQRLLLSRFVLVPATLLVAVGIWNVYVSFHNGGLVSGRVIDERGAPVADATVRLFAIEQTMSTQRATVKTGASGDFLFTGNDSHRIQLRAEKAGYERSDLRPVRLYFRAQNVQVTPALVVHLMANPSPSTQSETKDATHHR